MLKPVFWYHSVNLRMQVMVNKIQNILPICAEDSTSAGTIAIPAKGGNPGYNITIAQEIGPA